MGQFCARCGSLMPKYDPERHVGGRSECLFCYTIMHGKMGFVSQRMPHLVSYVLACLNGCMYLDDIEAGRRALYDQEQKYRNHLLKASHHAQHLFEIDSVLDS